MSHGESSHGTENPCVGVCDGRDDSADGDSNVTCVSNVNDSSDPDGSLRQRVLKEVGLTSTAFIGPAFPPTAPTVKTDIEDSLTDFYKELESLDTPDGANDNSGKEDAGVVQPPRTLPPETPTSKETQNVSKEKIVKSTETDGYQKNSGQKQPSWPHWYQNEPYYPRRPRPGMDPDSGRASPSQNQWHHPQTQSRQPKPSFHRPPFHHPPPPSAFSSPQNPPSHVIHNWSGSGMMNHYQEERHHSAVSSFPPPDVCSHPPQGFYGDPPYHFDRDERCHSYNAHSDHGNVGWSRDREEEWCQFGEDYDWRQRYDHCQPPDTSHAYDSSLVLILMRGLPGSGKSTLARHVFVQP